MRISDKDKEVIKKILSLEKTNNRQKIFSKQEDLIKRLTNYIKEGAADEIPKDYTD